MDKRKLDQISVGFSYIVLSICFIGIFVIPLSFVPPNEKITYHLITHYATTIGTDTAMYLILSGGLSLFVGIAVLFLKRNSTSLHIKVTIAISVLLILLDMPSIIDGIRRLIGNGNSGMLGTTFIFSFHLELLILLLKIIKVHLSKYAIYSVIGSSVSGIALIAFTIGYYIGSKEILPWPMVGVAIAAFLLMAALVSVININQEVVSEKK